MLDLRVGHRQTHVAIVARRRQMNTGWRYQVLNSPNSLGSSVEISGAIQLTSPDNAWGLLTH